MTSQHRSVDAERAQRLVKKLEQHPEVFDRVERLLEVVENETGEAMTADEAEELLVQELRRMGHDALQSWATAKNERLTSEYDARSDSQRQEKKGSTGRRGSGH
jgi:hypothetical protein